MHVLQVLKRYINADYIPMWQGCLPSFMRYCRSKSADVTPIDIFNVHILYRYTSVPFLFEHSGQFYLKLHDYEGIGIYTNLMYLVYSNVRVRSLMKR